MSQWLLDSDNYDAHVNLWNQLHSQHPQLLLLAWLCTMQSQPALNKTYAIGDEVLFKGSPEPYIFLGEKQIHQHDNGNQDEYLAAFRAPREPSYPPRSIQLIFHHRIQWDRIIPPPSFSVMGLVQGKTLEILLPLTHHCHEMILFWNCRWLASELMKTSGWHLLVNLSIVLLYDLMFLSHVSFYFYFS